MSTFNRQLVLAEVIEKTHEESHDKGYRRMKDDLEHDHGIHVNDTRVLRICRKKGIKSDVRKTTRNPIFRTSGC